MEAIRKIIDSNLLNGVVSLPKEFQNQKLEIIIFPVDERAGSPDLTKGEIDVMLKDSVTESLIGALSNVSLNLEDFRAERLNKYECVD